MRAYPSPRRTHGPAVRVFEQGLRLIVEAGEKIERRHDLDIPDGDDAAFKRGIQRAAL